MSIRSLALRFATPDPDELPGPGGGCIYVESGARLAGGAQAITPFCLTIAEFESEVARLKAELDEIVVEARSEYGIRRTPPFSGDS